MKKILCLCTLAIFIGTLSIDIKPITLDPITLNAASLVNDAVNPQTTALKIVFQEEFVAGPLKTTKWTNRLQWGRTNSPELEYYAPQNVTFSGNIMRLIAKKQSIGGKSFSSGAVVTYGHYKFTYGVVKIRAFVPAGKGLWPALWLLDYAGGAQEIDIAEIIGHQPNIVYMTLHYPTSSGNKSIGAHYTGPNFSSAFHIFSIDWKPTSITWYIDGIQRYKVTQNIPTKPMYLIMNLAVGGDWPGPPNSATKFPAIFGIDYVRIYQRK